MQSILQPFLAAALGIAGVALGILLLPFVLAILLAIALAGAGTMAYFRWRLRNELAGMARTTGAAPGPRGPERGRQPGRGRVIEGDYEVIRDR